MRCSTRLILGLALLALAPMACSTPATCPDPALQGADATIDASRAQGSTTLSAPIFALLSSSAAQRAKLYVDERGQITKVTIYTAREAAPEWLHALADAQIGQGPDESFEQEIYADIGLVYEVTRQVQGKRVELAAREDRSVHYIEQELTLDELPEPVKLALASEQILRVTRKTMGQTVLHQARVKRGEHEHRLVFDAQGALTQTSRVVPMNLELVTP